MTTAVIKKRCMNTSNGVPPITTGRGSSLDTGPWLEKLAPGLWQKGDFCGYDPLSERLCFFSKSRQSIDDFIDLFQCLDGDAPALIAVTLDDSGQSMIIVRPGQKARLSRIDGKKKTIRLYEVEPNIGDRDEIVDLRFYFENHSIPAKSCKMNNQVTLLNGKWSKLSSSHVADTDASKLRIKAELIRQP